MRPATRAAAIHLGRDGAVLGARQVAELLAAPLDAHGVGVVGVVRLADQVRRSPTRISLPERSPAWYWKPASGELCTRILTVLRLRWTWPSAQQANQDERIPQPFDVLRRRSARSRSGKVVSPCRASQWRAARIRRACLAAVMLAPRRRSRLRLRRRTSTKTMVAPSRQIRSISPPARGSCARRRAGPCAARIAAGQFSAGGALGLPGGHGAGQWLHEHAIRHGIVCRRHADRQPRRHHAARAGNAARAPTWSPARTPATPAACSTTTASAPPTLALHEHNEREAARETDRLLARRQAGGADLRCRHARHFRSRRACRAPRCARPAFAWCRCRGRTRRSPRCRPPGWPTRASCSSVSCRRKSARAGTARSRR